MNVCALDDFCCRGLAHDGPCDSPFVDEPTPEDIARREAEERARRPLVHAPMPVITSAVQQPLFGDVACT